MFSWIKKNKKFFQILVLLTSDMESLLFDIIKIYSWNNVKNIVYFLIFLHLNYFGK